jgi:hypothetical protein
MLLSHQIQKINSFGWEGFHDQCGQCQNGISTAIMFHWVPRQLVGLPANSYLTQTDKNWFDQRCGFHSQGKQCQVQLGRVSCCCAPKHSPIPTFNLLPLLVASKVRE